MNKNYNLESISNKDSLIFKYKKVFNDFLGSKTCWFFLPVIDESIDINLLKEKLKCECECNIVKEKERNYLKCIKDIERDNLLNSVIKDNKIVSFKCHADRNGICIPLSDQGRVYGVVIICNILSSLDKKILSFINVLKEIISDLIVKEAELKKLKETLHPRAIALSTIHTVHRIIGSTLELGELLPKIARLCIQIIRANRCTISLADENEKYLVPYVTIDLRDCEAKSRKINIGKGNIGKVAEDTQIYKSKNCVSLPLLNDKVVGVLTVWDKQGGANFDIYDVEILAVFAEQASVAIKNAELYEEQKKMIVESVNSLSALLSVQIPSPYLHNVGFVEIVEAVGYKSGLNQSELNALRYASMLRNVARVGIPGEILLKPDELTKGEYELVKQHSREMVELIRPLEILKPAIPILIHHREKYDGSGYPSGLKEQDIPLGARIMSVVEAFEAMIADRPYKKSMTISQAVKEIKKNKGTQFDPKIVKIFLELFNKGVIENIVKSHRG